MNKALLFAASLFLSSFVAGATCAADSWIGQMVFYKDGAGRCRPRENRHRAHSDSSDG